MFLKISLHFHVSAYLEEAKLKVHVQYTNLTQNTLEFFKEIDMFIGEISHYYYSTYLLLFL